MKGFKTHVLTRREAKNFSPKDALANPVLELASAKPDFLKESTEISGAMPRSTCCNDVVENRR